MRLGLYVGYSGARLALPMEMIQRADRLGYHSVWTAEAYGSDAVSPLAWIGAQTQRIHLGTAIMQMPGRTPAMTAMTAMSLDHLSGGRMLLGLGLSGPQVAEGWHGQAYGKPLVRTREYVAIVRAILARQAPVTFAGDYYQVPYAGPDATGLGKPLRSILHGRADLPIYLAAIGPKNVELAAEIADGWLPIFFAPEFYHEVFGAAVEAGFARAAEAGAPKSYETFDIAPSVAVVLGDDVDACRNMVRPTLALYVGGMGAKGKNFYFDLVSRYGFGDVAERVQTLYLAGRKEEAAAALPDALVDAVALCGPRERIAAGLERWNQAPVNTLVLMTLDPAAVELMAELVLGADVGRPDRSYSLPASSAEATTAAPDAGSTQKEAEPVTSATTEPRSASVFQHMSTRIANDPTLHERVNATYRFNITGERTGTWLVDLKNAPGAVLQGGEAEQPADCTITMEDDDFVALANGSLNAMAAFGQGKIKVQGNPMLAMKLQSLF
jgi:F420-dependent oxidoreductase-like protein